MHAAKDSRRKVWGAGVGGGTAVGAAGGVFVSWLAHKSIPKGSAIGAVLGACLGVATVQGLRVALQSLTDARNPNEVSSHVAQDSAGSDEAPIPTGPPLTGVNPKGPMKPGDMSLGKDFFMGTTTSATQAECGGIDNDITRWGDAHRSEGWEPFNPGIDHWNRLEKDYQHLEENGHNAHGLTVDWARIEPEEGVFDQAAIAHYKKEIATAREHGMEPMVTLLQYAIPPWLAEKGGYLSPDAPERFAEFTRVVAEELGDDVTWWNTMNEPSTVAAAGYLAGIWPPGKTSPIAMARVLEAQLKMHAAAAGVLHDVADEHHRKAMVGIVHIDDRVYPYQEWNPLDQFTSGLTDYTANRWFRDSMESGVSLAPIGDGKPVEGLKDSVDYIGLDFYGRDWGHVSLNGGYQGKANPDREGKQPAIDADGMYELTLSLWNQLHVPIMITESGVDTPEPDTQNRRGRAIVDSLAAIHHAQEAGVPVLGYMHWTDWDNPEWHDGWKQHYGLFGFDPQTGRRWDKPAAATFEAIARRHAIPQEWLSDENRTSPVTRDSHAAHELDVLRTNQ